MNGLQIFKSAVDDIVDNFTDALAISGVLWIAVAAIQIIVLSLFPIVPSTDPEVPVQFAMPNLLMSITVLVFSLWIAVAWHRFVILGERPTTVIPPFEAGYVWRYFVASLAVGFCSVLAVVPFAIAIAVLASVLPVIQSLSFFLILPIIYVGYRLSPALPRAALGNEKLQLRNVWRSTSEIKGAVFGAGVVISVAGALAQLVGAMVQIPIVGMVMNLLIGWLIVMVGVSVFSTIYRLADQEAFE